MSFGTKELAGRILAQEGECAAGTQCADSKGAPCPHPTRKEDFGNTHTGGGSYGASSLDTLREQLRSRQS